VKLYPNGALPAPTRDPTIKPAKKGDEGDQRGGRQAKPVGGGKHKERGGAVRPQGGRGAPQRGGFGAGERREQTQRDPQPLAHKKPK